MISYQRIKSIGLVVLVLIQAVMALLAFRQINYDQVAIEVLTRDLTEQLQTINRIERSARQAYTLFLYDTSETFVTTESIFDVVDEGRTLARLLASRAEHSALSAQLGEIATGFERIRAAMKYYDQAERIFSSDREQWQTIATNQFNRLFNRVADMQMTAAGDREIQPRLSTLYELIQVAQELFQQKVRGSVHQPEAVVRLLGEVQRCWGELDAFNREELVDPEKYRADSSALLESIQQIKANLPGVYKTWNVDPNLSYVQDEIKKLEELWDVIHLALWSLVQEEASQFQQKKEMILLNAHYGKVAFATAALSGLLSALLLAVLMSRALHRRLQALIIAIRHYSQGDLDYRVKIDGRDELAALAVSFNRMAAHLQVSKAELDNKADYLLHSQARLQEAHGMLEMRVAERTRELQAANDKLLLMGKVFQNAREGILVADSDGRIIMVNPEFLEMTAFSQNEVLGRRPAFLRITSEHGYLFGVRKHLLRDGIWSEEVALAHRNGQELATDLSVSPYHHEDGSLAGHVAIFHDLRKIKKQEELIRYQAHHDALTGLPNRLLLADRLAMAIERARRRRRKVGIIFMDLDDFKKINDTMGHQFGDEMLIAVAGELESSVRREDTVSRIAGDEFLILIEDAPDILTIHEIAQKIHQRISGYLGVNGRKVHVSASLGLAFYPDHGETADELIKNADLAMYSAKDQGKNAFHVFTREMDRKSREALELEDALRAGLDAGEFEVFYQPQVNLADRRFVGAEALVRWNRPGHGVVAPATFIPACEETGLILPLGRFVLRSTCRFAADFCRQPGCQNLRFSVNVSARQFTDSKLLDIIEEALEDSGLPANNLEIEITESSMMMNVERTRRVLEQLEWLGVTIAIDDFGTGYSSLTQLKNFPIHTLKIDRGFIRDVPGDASDEKIIETIIAMARNLGIEGIAEGVETEEQCRFLERLGCEKMQGYLISPPVRRSELKTVHDRLNGCCKVVEMPERTLFGNRVPFRR